MTWCPSPLSSWWPARSWNWRRGRSGGEVVYSWLFEDCLFFFLQQTPDSTVFHCGCCHVSRWLFRAEFRVAQPNQSSYFLSNPSGLWPRWILRPLKDTPFVNETHNYEMFTSRLRTQRFLLTVPASSSAWRHISQRFMVLTYVHKYQIGFRKKDDWITSLENHRRQTAACVRCPGVYMTTLCFLSKPIEPGGQRMVMQSSHSHIWLFSAESLRCKSDHRHA